MMICATAIIGIENARPLSLHQIISLTMAIASSSAFVMIRELVSLKFYGEHFRIGKTLRLNNFDIR